MGVLSLLGMSSFFTPYLINGSAGLALPPNQVLDSPNSLTLTTPNVSDQRGVEACTSSLIWTGSTGYDAAFTEDCYHAQRKFQMTDLIMHRGAQYEFLMQGVTPGFPGKPKMATPRRYVESESTFHLECKLIPLTRRCPDSCTLAIANLADIPSGILPDEPPGPFPRSDLARFTDIRLSMVAVRAGCLGKKRKSGWAVVGKYIPSGLSGQVLSLGGH